MSDQSDPYHNLRVLATRAIDAEAEARKQAAAPDEMFSARAYDNAQHKYATACRELAAACDPAVVLALITAAAPPARQDEP